MTWPEYYTAKTIPDLIYIPAFLGTQSCIISSQSEELGPTRTYNDGYQEWLYGKNKLHRFRGPAVTRRVHFCDYFLFGKGYDAHNHEIAVNKMKKVKQFIRNAKMRRFLKLCRSKAFNELFYGEGGMGRRWDHAKIMGWSSRLSSGSDP